MRVVRNQGYLKRRQRGTRLMIALGLSGLLGSIALTFLQTILAIYLAYALLITGFLFFNAGMQQWAKWNRRPRPDEILDSTLRRLNDRYTLIHYSEVPGAWRPEHVLVWPGGLLNITTRELPGRIVVKGNRWRRLDRFILRLLTFGGPPLGNPTVECRRQIETLRTFLKQRDLPGADLVDGLIVFLHDQAQLEVVESPITVVHREELLEAVRAFGTERRLTQGEIDEITAALSQGEQVEGPLALSTRTPAKAK